MTRRAHGSVTATFLVMGVLLGAPSWATGQTQINFCYNNRTGVLYVIDPSGTSQLPTGCVNPNHVMLSFVDGAGANHDDLTNVLPDQHHARYTDAEAVAAVGAVGTVFGSGVATRVAFWEGPSTLGSSADLYWDAANARLGIGKTNPLTTLDVAGLARAISADGTAGAFISSNTTGSPTLSTNASGDGLALNAFSTGLGSAGGFQISNPANARPAVSASTNGTGPAVYGNSGGTGAGIRANSAGGGNIAEFAMNSATVARIDATGKGFFNGGTQTGGADLAEAFEVEDGSDAYRPGDVLAISARHDRRVELSAEPYSTRVIGVYATKPGILLSDRDVGESLDGTVPVGVVGVIPTKVSAENGAIRRGDLLVAASTPGHAMLGTDRSRMLGAVLGKALQGFDGPGTGTILVMVNAR